MPVGVEVQPKIYDHATAFFCIPLRTSVLLIGFSSFLLGFAILVDRVETEANLRQYIGGYTRTSRSVIGFLDFLGLFFGLLGMIGALNLRANQVQLFLGFQAARLAAWFWMYYHDLQALWKCELWGTDVNKAAKLFGWNSILFDIAVESGCQSERQWFLMLSLPTLLFSVYCTLVTQKALADLEEEPAFLFKAPLGVVNGASYSRSLASASIHTQMRTEATSVEKAKDYAKEKEDESLLEAWGHSPKAADPMNSTLDLRGLKGESGQYGSFGFGPGFNAASGQYGSQPQGMPTAGDPFSFLPPTAGGLSQPAVPPAHGAYV
mmetsp:Transcript_98735/g.205806  ORF Transcript_98735/g.205806 Transcript_98735/m.205806 type:complete len:321 (+) Transcript_98735:90-1052(+)